MIWAGDEHFTDSEVTTMTGRNNKPDNDGPAAAPSRLDQFGDKLADNSAHIPKKKGKGAGTGEKCD
jgi:hypothetical protein